jgi:hypothetical protein
MKAFKHITRNMMHKTCLIFFVVIVLAFSSCKDDNLPIQQYFSQGYISGNFAGANTYNAYDETFKLSQNRYGFDELLGNVSYYQIYDGGKLYFSLTASDFKSGNSIWFAFYLENQAAQPVFLSCTMNLNMKKDSELVPFSILRDPLSPFSLSVTFSDFIFDPKTGHVKAKYKCISEYNNTLYIKAIITGDFDLKLKQLVR